MLSSESSVVVRVSILGGEVALTGSEASLVNIELFGRSVLRFTRYTSGSLDVA